MTSTECGGTVRPWFHGSTVETESPDFSHGEYVKRFVAKTAKTVKVYVERTYDRSKHDYYTTILVLVDNKPELLLPSMFVDRVVAAI